MSRGRMILFSDADLSTPIEELDKMIPDLALAEKLEHALKIKLRVPAEEPNVQPALSSKPTGATLGDLIQFKVRDKEAKK